MQAVITQIFIWFQQHHVCCETLLLSYLLDLNFKSGLHRSIPKTTNVIWKLLFWSEKSEKKPGAMRDMSHLFCQAWFFGDVAFLLIAAFSFTATQRRVAVNTWLRLSFCESPNDLDSSTPSSSSSSSVAVVYPPHPWRQSVPCVNTDASVW